MPLRGRLRLLRLCRPWPFIGRESVLGTVPRPLSGRGTGAERTWQVVGWKQCECSRAECCDIVGAWSHPYSAAPSPSSAKAEKLGPAQRVPLAGFGGLRPLVRPDGLWILLGLGLRLCDVSRSASLSSPLPAA